MYKNAKRQKSIKKNSIHMLKYIENSVGIHRCTCMIDIYIIIF